MLNKLVSLAKDFTEKIPLGKSALEQLLFQATSSDNYMIPHEKLYEISSRTSYYEDCSIIMSHIWERLRLPAIEWRKIYKALYLIDIILRTGDMKCVSEFKMNQHKLKSFEFFSYKDNGNEKGTGIREKAKIIVELLDNSELLNEEREKAESVRKKLSGGVKGSGDKYGGISSDSYYSSGGSSYSGGDVKPKKSVGASEKSLNSKKKEPKKEEQGDEVQEAEDYKKKVASKKKVAPEPKEPPKPAVIVDLLDIGAVSGSQSGPVPQDKKVAPVDLTEIFSQQQQQVESNTFDDFVSAPPPAVVPVPMPAPAPKHTDIFDLSASVAPVQPAKPILEENDFDDFRQAPPAPSVPAAIPEKKAEPPKRSEFWDDAKDMVDLDGLASKNKSEPFGGQNKKPGKGQADSYWSIYGKK